MQKSRGGSNVQRWGEASYSCCHGRASRACLDLLTADLCAWLFYGRHGCWLELVTCMLTCWPRVSDGWDGCTQLHAPWTCAGAAARLHTGHTATIHGCTCTALGPWRAHGPGGAKDECQNEMASIVRFDLGIRLVVIPGRWTVDAYAVVQQITNPMDVWVLHIGVSKSLSKSHSLNHHLESHLHKNRFLYLFTLQQFC